MRKRILLWLSLKNLPSRRDLFSKDIEITEKTLLIESVTQNSQNILENRFYRWYLFPWPIRRLKGQRLHRIPQETRHLYPCTCWDGWLSSMMSEDILCPAARDRLLHIQIPPSWWLHACPCVWSHRPTCFHSFIFKNRQRAWHGVDGDRRSPLFGALQFCMLVNILACIFGAQQLSQKNVLAKSCPRGVK